MATCTPPAIIPDFAEYSETDWQQASRPWVSASTPESCSPDLTGQAAADCASFTQWTQVISPAARCLSLASSLVHKFLDDDDLANKIVTSIHAIYDALRGVNQKFLEAIHDINLGKEYEPLPEPATIPDFPEPKPGEEIGQAVESVWELVKLVLNANLAKLPPHSSWTVVLEGLITKSDDIVDQLKKLFEPVAD